jgi:hypothetical protein
MLTNSLPSTTKREGGCNENLTHRWTPSERAWMGISVFFPESVRATPMFAELLVGGIRDDDPRPLEYSERAPLISRFTANHHDGETISLAQ